MLLKCKNKEEEQQVRKAILDCSLIGGNKEAFEDEFQSEEDEEEGADSMQEKVEVM